MEISERLEKLQLEKDKISKEISDLKSEIENKQKEQIDLLENPKSAEYLQITKTLRGMNENLDDRLALNLAISRQIEQLTQINLIEEKKQFLAKIDDWIEQMKKNPPSCKRCLKEFEKKAFFYDKEGRYCQDNSKLEQAKERAKKHMEARDNRRITLDPYIHEIQICCAKCGLSQQFRKDFGSPPKIMTSR